jgi:hypothetical protein
MTENLNEKVDSLPSDALEQGEAAPDLDMHVLDGQIYTVLRNRIQRAMKKQQPWWDAGRARREFMDGKQWEADLAALLSPKNGWIRKVVNKMRALRTGLISQIAFQKPRVTALPLRRVPDFIGKATVASTLINHSIRETGFASHQKKAALEAMAFGAGALRLCTNPEKGGIAGVEHVCIEDVVFDPDAKTIEDAKWVAYRFPLNIFVARKEYNCESLLSDRQHAKANGADVSKDEIAPEDETVEIWEIWCRADAINFADAEENSERNKVKDSLTDKAPAMLKYLTEEGNRVFHISLNHNKILKDEPWPFILDNDMLPIWPMYLEESPHCLLPESVLEPAVGLQRALNTQLTFLITQAYVTARIKFSADKGTLADPQVQKGLKSAEVGTIVGTEGGQLGINPINLGGLNLAMLELFKQVDYQFNQITGYAEMFGGMQGTRSAAEAVIREDRAQTNSSTMRVAFETGLERLIRGMWQISMSTLSHKKVADIVGREEMGYVNSEGVVDADEEKNIVPINWPYDKATPAEIRRENFIEYVVNSTRRSNPQQEVQDLNTLMQNLIGLIGTYTQQGYRISPVRMARKLNYILSRILQAMGMADYKQMEITPEDLSIDDRLMPRGQTEEQMLAKLQKQQAEEAEQADVAGIDGITEYMAQSGADPAAVQAQLAQLTPEMRKVLIQAIEGA